MARKLRQKDDFNQSVVKFYCLKRVGCQIQNHDLNSSPYDVHFGQPNVHASRQTLVQIFSRMACLELHFTILIIA